VGSSEVFQEWHCALTKPLLAQPHFLQAFVGTDLSRIAIILEQRWRMTAWRRVAIALLLALPIEAGNVFLCGMMFDPGPFPAGIFPRLLAYEWAFFHLIGFWLMERLFGTERAAMNAAFILAYLQTALVLFFVLTIAKRFRSRTGEPRSSAQAHSS
jgi:hypothetical protein